MKISKGAVALVFTEFIGNKRLPIAVLLLFFLAGVAQAKPVKDVDAYVDKDYDFAAIKSLYIWPAIVDPVPESVRLSMPGNIDTWAERDMRSKNMKNAFFLKPTKSVWQSVMLLYGDGGFKEPFESAESAAYFYSKLDGACGAVLKISVSVKTERKWREPYTETYQTTERVHSQERRRNSEGKYEYVDVYIDMPVTKTRERPGYWYILADASCHLALYDTKRLDGRPVVEARVARSDQGSDADEKKMLEDLVGRMVNDTIATVFYN